MAAAGVVSAEIPKSAKGGDDLLLSRYRMLDLSTVDSFMDGSLSSSSSSLISGFSDLGFLCSIVKIEAEMHAVNALAVARMLMGSGGTVIVLAAEDISFGSLWWYLYDGISCFLVLFTGIMSGLTLGLMSLGLVELEILQRSGTLTKKKQAAGDLEVNRSGDLEFEAANPKIVVIGFTLTFTGFQGTII
ncbi:hypothetical protein J5N97_011794 [Dioscorea zingiberensis]|uniref:CNNM transmembrane domain-containing protein n=1 Tax=Dioscorea zingiberensis TaxID=325984 RepID=A0A9D5HNU9_9LILI|nr:hypothetical protein J5N97_011794 [Dioscorea zingiberensis]